MATLPLSSFNHSVVITEKTVFVEEKKNPLMGLVIILVICAPFWAGVSYLIWG